jgi:pSer/pThr/pTyr-binding forkhead associated (FHA) protein
MPDGTSFIYIALGAAIVLALVLAFLLLNQRRKPQPAPTPPAQPDPIAFLERVEGEDGARLYALNKPLHVVGRGEDSDVRITADIPGAMSVSRRHAQIRREDFDFVVEDLGSRNGIKVNGLVTHRNLLRDGYHVAFGSVEFIFHQSQPGRPAGSDV